MAKQLLFQFWVKPSGFLARKRYANVFVDTDNGNITQEPVPGKEIINLNSLTDYKSNNYPYSEGQEITRFCNTTTFTQYRILAKRSKDWAITQTDLNAPICGYLEPLPTPAVPSNPFGVAPYAVAYSYGYCTINGIAKRVDIHKRNFTGEPIEIDKGGKSPIVYVYECEEKLQAIRPKTCEFTFMAQENFQLQDIYTADEREYKLQVIDVATDQIDFSGFIIPDSSEEPFNPPPYPVTIRATDGLGALKTITYPMPVGSSTDIRQSFLFILAFALAKTNLNLDIMTMVNVYSAGMLNGLNDDPLAQASVNPLRMSSSSGDIYTCYEALDALCAQFGASIQQVNGQWRFARINELANGTGRYRLYDYTARFKFAGTLSTLRNVASSKSTDVILEAGARTTILPPYKMVRVLQEFGRTPDVVYNGNFEDWDGQNFRYWTRYGNINVTRVKKQIVASNGVKIDIDDYACSFNEKASASKWLEGSKIYVNEGQKGKLNINIGNTDGLYDFKVRFKIGQFYLTNATGTFQWVTQLSTTTIRIDNNKGDIFSFAISIELPEAPISGDMILQFYGFVKLARVESGSVPPSGARPTKGGESGINGSVVTYYEIDEYKPITIDNVSLSTTVDDDKKTKGIINVSYQNGFYTNKPEEITILWGEFIGSGFDPVSVKGSFTPTRPTREGDLSSLPDRQLQTIYNPDNSASGNWYEFGENGAPAPIGLVLARSILRAYQQPYKKIGVTLRGNYLGYFDTFNIIVQGNDDFSSKIFMFLDVVFDDKYNTAEGNLVEIFSKPVASNDYTKPDIGGTDGGLPPIIQNPNPPIKISGIFTEEFTPEFT